jgi:hypothetical protein
MSPEHSALLRQALDQVPALHARHQALHGEAPGSPHSQDLRVSKHARFVRTGAIRVLGTAGDHLVAFRRLSERGPILPFAPMTLLRAAVEAADLARWLVDPELDAMTRIGRGVAVQLEDYEQRRRWEGAFGIPEPPPGARGKSAAARKADLLAARGPDVPDAERVPVVPLEKATALALIYGPARNRGPVADALPAGDRSWLYRLLSAFAHGKEWAFLATDTRAAQPIGEGVHRGVVMISDPVFVACTVATIDQVARAMTAVERYVGRAAT